MTVFVLSVILRSVANTLPENTRTSISERIIFEASLLTKSTHRAKFFVAARKKIGTVNGGEFAQLLVKYCAQSSRHSGGIILRPTFGFRNDLVNQVMSFEIFR